jgi:hypothetical protein
MKGWVERFRVRFPSDAARVGARGALLLVAGLLIGTASSSRADVLERTASRDNSLFAEEDLSSGAGPSLFAGNTGAGMARRALIFYDVAGLLPAGAKIDSVTVTLQVTNAPNDLPRRFTLHRLLCDWGEAPSVSTGGSGAAAEIGDATWFDAFFPGQRWSSPGGDFEPVASSTQTVNGLGSYTWRGAGLSNDVRAWMAQPGSNYGWLLQGEEVGLNTARRFSSREAGEAIVRPTISIHYTPAVVARSNSWGGVKARYR